MGKYILCFKILLVCLVIENASAESGRCERRPVCGSDGRVYQTSCDFERALRRDQALGAAPLSECLGMMYVVMPTENFWASGNSKSPLMSARKDNRNNSVFAKKFIENLRLVAKKAIENVGKEKAIKAVQAMRDEIGSQVKILLTQVEKSLDTVVDDMKRGNSM